MQPGHKKIAFLGLMLFAAFVFAAPLTAAAQGTTTQSSAERINVKLQVPLPFVKTECPKTETVAVRQEDGTYAPQERTVNTVCNLRDYISGVYKLLIGAGALFAVVMIIIAGYQWMFSGGSSDRTGAAKKRIFGAGIGLILALLSYIILNAITPRLVELRLPQVDPVKPFFSRLDESFCQTDKDLRARYETLKPEEQQKFLAPLVAGRPGQFSKGLDDAECGTTYLIADNAGQCTGNQCSSGNRSSCIQGQCQRWFLHGNINWSDIRLLGFSNAYVDKIKVYYLCEGDEHPQQVAPVANYEQEPTALGAYAFTKDVFVPGQPGLLQVYKDLGAVDRDANSISQYHVMWDQCSKYGGFKGFVLEVEVNDDRGGWWNILPTIDDDFAVGKNCASPIFMTTDKGAKQYDFEKIDFKGVGANELFSLDDFNNGAACDIVINRNS
ncbi:MAG: TrbC/VirB2 family protein, partial [Parcubacteria group bacterium]|nr:TrbC/VirB2 family protein [Parcubacteria group bacterium]